MTESESGRLPVEAGRSDACMTENSPVGEDSAVSDPFERSSAARVEGDLAMQLDKQSLEAIVEHKIARFLDQIGSFYPDNVYDLIMKKVEKPLVKQILLRTGGNQVHAARILGINRNTLRKKMKLFGL